ncbi:hypothetical protein BDV41DRAFT_526466 [Aspergillus transmontanensis]|uniref:Uncharacterized protein n=1 Tax=Aspergillus transmontanensis TaxID=1034304 RepID=A0A5N6W9B3_9EURO|nr:hypothetical protein BDV41DRAFT_526466 [Aspergillus transmontanensis]
MPQATLLIPGKWSSDQSPLGLLAAGEVMNPELHLFNGPRRGSAVEFQLAYNEDPKLIRWFALTWSMALAPIVAVALPGFFRQRTI